MGQKRKLFLSWTGVLNALIEDRITIADLDQGLFFFSCSKSEVVKKLSQLSDDDPYSFHVYLEEKISQILFKAEIYDRVRWSLAQEKPAYYHLNFLLVANGYKHLDPPHYYLFTPEEITRLMNIRNPELEVID